MNHTNQNSMVSINILTIPVEKMRYPTCGDYWYDQYGTLQIRVADIGDEFYEKMIIIHELIEEAITKKNGITEQQIMDFDLRFEADRKKGNLDEPGFDKNCIYRKEHTFATSVEIGMCAMANVDFVEYDTKVNEL
jgi:hypothetical protein